MAERQVCIFATRSFIERFSKNLVSSNLVNILTWQLFFLNYRFFWKLLFLHFIVDSRSSFELPCEFFLIMFLLLQITRRVDLKYYLKFLTSWKMYLPELYYHFLLFVVLIPVYYFFRLWAWLGWELFVNN